MISRRELVLTGLLTPTLAHATERPVLRIGTLAFGTVSWEAETIRMGKLDEAAGYRLETVRLATNDAARVAFQAGQVDLIVSDLLLAARLRNDGRAIRYLPFSTTEGAVMVPPQSPVRSLKDLQGRRIGVAGGALDKSWVLLQAHVKNTAGLDLSRAAEAVYGAPPLLAGQLEAGALDAALLYWQFCARLEAKGFRTLVSAGDILRSFGLEDDIALIGYVFDEAIERRHPGLLKAFAASSQEAKRLLARDEAVWAAIRPLMEAPDAATYETLRRSFIAGIPRRPIPAEQADAAKLYKLLRDLGGEALVGKGHGLPEGLYFDPGA